MAQLLAQLLIRALSGTVVDDGGGAGVVLVRCFLDLLIVEVPPLLSATRVVPTRVGVQSIKVELFCCVVLVECFIFLGEAMLPFVSSIQNCVLVESRGSRRLDTILKAYLRIVNRIGECGRRASLDPHLVLIQLKCVALADAYAIIEVAEGI